MKNRKLFIINCIIFLYLVIIYFAQLRLEKFEGFEQKFQLVVRAPILIIPMLIYGFFVMTLFRVEKREKAYLVVSSIVLTLLVQLAVKYTGVFYNHYRNAYAIRTERYPIEDISLKNLDEIYKGNYLIYISKASCGECSEAEEYLKDFIQNQPVKIYHYDTEKDRVENKDYLERVLDKYSVWYVPAIVIIENGEYQKTLFSRQIKEELADNVQSYKVKNVYFTK
jgi:hypothetical protein